MGLNPRWLINNKPCAKANDLKQHLSNLSFYKDSNFLTKNKSIQIDFSFKEPKNAFKQQKSPARMSYIRTGPINVFV